MDDSSYGEILHVDDDPLVLEALRLPLLADGYAVTVATSAAEALGHVSAGLVPDVMIVDFNLGDDTDGSQLILQVRHHLHHCPPVILLTANPEDAEMPWITDAPIWLARKPMPTELLLACLPGLVQVARATRQSASRTAARVAGSSMPAWLS